MNQSAFVLIVLIVVSGCGANSARYASSTAEITIDGTSIIYKGTISRESNQRLFDLFENDGDTVSALVISSSGGDALAGIELGRWVFRNRLDVSVTEYCISSCANYVFVAGNRKAVTPSAAVVWHGGALQTEWNHNCSDLPGNVTRNECESAIESIPRLLDEWRVAEASFFLEIGVDQRVTVLGQDPDYDCRDKPGYLGWYYSIQDLGQMGVDNISVSFGEWQPKPPSRRAKICRVVLDQNFRASD